MKRLVKILIIILCVAFLFSCSTEIIEEVDKPALSVDPIETTAVPADTLNPTEKPKATENPTETPVPSASEPIRAGDIVFEISSQSPFFDEDAKSYGYNYSDDYNVWRDEIESRFGIKLKVTSLYDLSQDLFIFYYQDRSDIYGNIKTYIDNGTINGLFRVGAATYVTKLAADGLILPLDQFIGDNANWKTMPEGYKQAYSLDGVTYGLPTSYYDKTFTRFFRQDWLYNVGLKLPSTIDEFYEVLKKFTYNDPDGDDKENTSGTIYYGQVGIEDIFASFDARLNPDGKLIPTWNPNSNLWEDSMLKPEMAECFEFLRSCRKEMLIVKTQYGDNGTQFDSGYSGSYCSWSSAFMDGVVEKIEKSRPDRPEPVISYIPAMSHLIDDNINCYFTNYQAPVVLTKNSRYPDTTINTFLDVFMADKVGYLLGRYGPEKIAFTMDNDLVIYKTFENEDRLYAYEGPAICYANPLNSFKKISDVLYASNKYESDVLARERLDQRMDGIKANSMCYEAPWKVVFPDYTETMASFLGDLELRTRSMINDIMIGGVSYEDALREYRTLAKNMGLQEFLDKQNNILGASSWQTY